MASKSFQQIQWELDFLSNEKIQSLSYKSDSIFLKEMNGIYNIIRKNGEQKIHEMLNRKHQSAINFFKPIIPNIQKKIIHTETIQLINIIDEIDSMVLPFSLFFIKIEKLDSNIKNHKLMKSFLFDISNNIKKKEINQKSAEFDRLVADIKSQLKFFDYLNQYNNLKDIYPSLKNEINQLIKSNKNNYDDLILHIQKFLPKIQLLTNEIKKINNDVKCHIIMKNFLHNLHQNINTVNFDFFQSQFYIKLKESQNDIRYHKGWKVGDYHCYGNSVVLDTTTGLYWYQTNITAISYKNAKDKLKMFNESNHHNFNNWRIPKSSECCFHANAIDAGFFAHQYFWTDTKANLFQLINELFGLCQIRFKKNWWFFLIFIPFFILFDFAILIFSKKYLCFNIANKRGIVNKAECSYHIMIVSGKKR